MVVNSGSAIFGKSTNILWHKSSVDKIDRQELLQQKGCVIWITGLSGSGLLDVTSIMFYVYELIVGICTGPTGR
ncbi:hypothetical protein Patl1_28517 [Pistacia atlantica]|uniref:Uncharacterized protein n=1 Tax=Pistacia atlantica TaxID=434234 RepID=A0ACC1BEJ9_9ROSI|nr:hypothetical protein Patl1_28517 [Pistacia atlantica]